MKKKISTWQIGKIKITRIIEGERAGPMFVLPDATPENILKCLGFNPIFPIVMVIQ